MATTGTRTAQDHDEDDVVHDDLIASSESGASSTLTNLFDLRVIIGGLFTLYGVYLTILGIFDTAAEVEKAAGVRINLWTGLGLLVVGLGFLAWARLRPLVQVMAEGQADDATAEFLEPEVRESRGHAGNPSH
jgi:hypothetical protein